MAASMLRSSLAAAGVFLLLLGGTWGGYSFWRRHQAVQWQLKQTAASLEEKAQALQGLEEERARLSEDYEMLKTRWSSTDQELKQAQAASEQVQQQLSSLSQEQSELKRRLGDSERQQSDLQAQREQLSRQMQTQMQRNAEMQQQLAMVAGSGLTRAEMEQLAQQAAAQKRETDDLEGRMQALSHAFEELAWKHIELQEAAPQLAAAAAEPPEVLAEAPAADKRQTLRENSRLAKRYRHLGEWCMAAYQYPQAAEALERSLTYRDDPDTHATLAFLYSRLLLNGEKAAHHAALAPAGYTTKTALDSTTKAQGLPRKTRNLVWDWLVK